MTSDNASAEIPAHVKEMIARLIGFPTVSRDSNLALIDFVRSYLSSLGFESRLVPNDTGSKANLYATIGPDVPGGVVLSGHTDVVPIDGQNWTTDPWVLTERDGKLLGRGTCDMKTFCALGLAVLPQFLAKNPNKPIHLAFSYDEEVGCIGAPSMIEKMVHDVPNPRAVFVGEPTDMKVVTGHKSIVGIETKVVGHSVHSCQIDRGVSAVMTGARLVTFLEDVMLDNRMKADPNSPFDPPYTTVHCGVIEGGTASNIVSKDCRFLTDIRTIADEQPEEYLERYVQHVKQTVEPAIKSIRPEASISVTNRPIVPGLRPEQDGTAEQLARQLTGDNSGTFVSYATEAGQFQAKGYSVIVCGPGSIDQAHQPDEFITLDQVAKGWAFMERLADTLVDG